MEAILKEDTGLPGTPTKRISGFGKFALAVTGGIGLGLSVVCYSFLSPAFRKHCLPYVPATTEQVKNVLSVLKKNSPGKLLDIGSGDGRIVIAACKHGIESHGVELNPWLVLYSKLDAYRQGVWSKTKFFKRDLWNFKLDPYDYIVIFGVEKMMTDLEHKISKEVRQGSKIIACRFPLPNLVPDKIIGSGVDTVWLYNMNK